MYKTVLFIFVLSLPLVSVSLDKTQIPEASPALKEKLYVDLVDLYLTATDKKGSFVTDLRAADLIVQEDGITQTVTSFANFAHDTHDVPLTLASVIDTSGSMSDEVGDVWKIEIARNASLMLLEELNPNDKSMVVSFGEAPVLSALTPDKKRIQEIVQQIRVSFSYTALHDALSQVIDQLNQEFGRKILLICSDGNDNISKATLDEVIEKLVNSPEISIIALGTVSNQSSLKWSGGSLQHIHGKDNLKQLADKSGGYAFFPSTLKEVDKVRELMRGFLRSQYSLAYKPSNRNMNGAWRKIKISCKRKDVKLRYRSGYYAR